MSALAFDVDGTLADTESIHLRAYRAVFEPLGIHVTPDSVFGLSTRSAVMRLLREAAHDRVDELVRAKQDEAARLLGEAREIPGARRFISLARARGHALAVCSAGSRRNVRATLHALGLDDAFSVIVTSEDVAHSKPDPEPYELVARRLGVNPYDVTAFEDSDAGVLSAFRAGCRVVRIRSRWDAQAERVL